MEPTRPAHLRVRLQTSPEQTERLRTLQARFAQACNALAPLARTTACWNRVALHHMAYRQLREQFPELGSQMVCNVIYSVSRTFRLVFQNRASPFSLQRLAGRPMPLVQFSPQSPVYFDRHTLSVKDGVASMYTLDGRMRFRIPVGPSDEQRFHGERLREIVLRRTGPGFELLFTFGEGTGPADRDDGEAAGKTPRQLPRYIEVIQPEAPIQPAPHGPWAADIHHAAPSADTANASRVASSR